MWRRSAAVLGCVALVSACTPGAREAEPFIGIWESEGWGTFLLVQGGDVEIFEHSAVHCLSVASGGARGIGDVLSFEGDRLLMDDSDREVRFDPIDVLPLLCADSGRSQDPAYAIAVLAATLEEQAAYPLDPGWEERRSTALARAQEPDPPALLDVVEDLVGPLEWQVQVATGDGEVWPAAPLLTPPEGTVVGGGDGFAVGSVGDGVGVGYLALARTGPFDADTAASERILSANVDKSLSGSAFILDLRFTDGGILGHALLLATRFFPTGSLVGRLEARDGDGFVPAGDLTVTPVPTGTYDGQVLVLIGPRTRGIGELLAAILGELPNVTLVGEATAGLPGPPLIRFLPNGWSVAVPNLRVVDPGGSIIGAVRPDVVSDDPLGTALELAG